MASSSSLELVIKRREPELITPSEPTPYETKYLSDIDDQQIFRFHIPCLHFYRKNDGLKGKDPVKVIRQAIAKTLVHYYPFAGRLREGPNRKLMVECTGEGVLFIEANANVTLDYFNGALLPPFRDLDELLYDVPGSSGLLNRPLLLIQVTRLTCGGFIVALRLNHTMSDAVGLAQLMNAIGEIARGIPTLSVQPVWKRELLMARDPPHVTCIHDAYDEASNPRIMPVDVKDMVHRLFFFGPAETLKIRNHLPSHFHKSSTFEMVTACLWRCRILALEMNDPNAEVRVQLALNARNKYYPPLPEGYYGNVIASANAEARAGKLCENPLGYALDLVKKAKASVTDEYMRSLADYMVLKGRPSVKPLGTYAVSDVRNSGFGEVDFGWGRPVYGGPAKGDVGVVPGVTSFYLPTINNEGVSGLAATVSLPGAAMERFVMELDKLTKDPPALQGVPQVKRFNVSSAL